MFSYLSRTLPFLYCEIVGHSHKELDEEAESPTTAYLTYHNEPAEWAEHIARKHGVSYWRPGSEISALHFFCSYCDDFIYIPTAAPSSRDEHYAMHLEEAKQVVAKRGYNEALITSKGISIISVRHPRSCIFCFHNISLTVCERLTGASENVGNSTLSDEAKNHYRAHFNSIEDCVPCPASALASTDYPLCLCTATFTAAELDEHLIETHHLYNMKGLSIKVQPPTPKKRGRPSSKPVPPSPKQQKRIPLTEIPINQPAARFGARDGKLFFERVEKDDTEAEPKPVQSSGDDE